MCLYPRLLLNRKYTFTKKNKGNIPKMKDNRTKYVAVGCGKCIECVKQRANAWKIRLFEEIKNNQKNAFFITLTFNKESLNKLESICANENEGIIEENEVATIAVRRFLERFRKKYGKSCRHWLITELGHTGTERIHLHGILWTSNIDELDSIWQYGWIYKGQYVNEKTINYITKYVTKIDKDHPHFTGKILCSPGIGSQFKGNNNKFKEKDTNELYTTRQGYKQNLPTYFRNKLYTEEEREKLWIQKLDKNERWVCGEKIDMNQPNAEQIYYDKLKFYREKNKRLGFGKLENWSKNKYKNALKHININKN